MSTMKYQLQEIEIETINRCNGKCSFCPVNVYEKQRPYKKMSSELFEKIVNDLRSMNYGGKISVFSNNEPFIDERIVWFYKFVKDKLPNAYTNLYTNGSLMNFEKFLEIIDYLDYFVIDNYNDDLMVNDNLIEVKEYIDAHKELQCKVVFDIRKQNEVRLSRGGQAPNKPDAISVDEICLLPYRQMVIRPDGLVSLCCNDALGKYTLGNACDQSIEEIWNSEKYNKIRSEMELNHRKNLILCNKCDMVTQPLMDKRS